MSIGLVPFSLAGRSLPPDIGVPIYNGTPKRDPQSSLGVYSGVSKDGRGSYFGSSDGTPFSTLLDARAQQETPSNGGEQRRPARGFTAADNKIEATNNPGDTGMYQEPVLAGPSPAEQAPFVVAGPVASGESSKAEARTSSTANQGASADGRPEASADPVGGAETTTGVSARPAASNAAPARNVQKIENAETLGVANGDPSSSGNRSGGEPAERGSSTVSKPDQVRTETAGSRRGQAANTRSAVRARNVGPAIEALPQPAAKVFSPESVTEERPFPAADAPARTQQDSARTGALPGPGRPVTEAAADELPRVSSKPPAKTPGQLTAAHRQVAAFAEAVAVERVSRKAAPQDSPSDAKPPQQAPKTIALDELQRIGSESGTEVDSRPRLTQSTAETGIQQGRHDSAGNFRRTPVQLASELNSPDPGLADHHQAAPQSGSGDGPALAQQEGRPSVPAVARPEVGGSSPAVEQLQVQDKERAASYSPTNSSATERFLRPMTLSQPEGLGAPDFSAIRESHSGLAWTTAHHQDSKSEPRAQHRFVSIQPDVTKAVSTGGGRATGQGATETAYEIKMWAQPGSQARLLGEDTDLSPMGRFGSAARTLSTARPQAVEAVDHLRVGVDKDPNEGQPFDSTRVVRPKTTSTSVPSRPQSVGDLRSQSPVGGTEPARVQVAGSSRSSQETVPQGFERKAATPVLTHVPPATEAAAVARQGNAPAAAQLGLVAGASRNSAATPDMTPAPAAQEPEPAASSQPEGDGEAPSAKQRKQGGAAPSQSQLQQPDKADRPQPVTPDTRAANASTPRPAESAVALTPRSETAPLTRGAATESPEAQGAGKQQADSPRAMERIVEMASLQKKLNANRMNVLLQDERLGRVVVRLTERAGLVDAMVRADSTRAREVIAENLPSLMESLSRRGLQAFAFTGGGHDLSRDELSRHQGGRSRHPRGFFRRGRRAASDPSVFRVQMES